MIVDFSEVGDNSNESTADLAVRLFTKVLEKVRASCLGRFLTNTTYEELSLLNHPLPWQAPFHRCIHGLFHRCIHGLSRYVAKAVFNGLSGPASVNSASSLPVRLNAASPLPVYILFRSTGHAPCSRGALPGSLQRSRHSGTHEGLHAPCWPCCCWHPCVVGTPILMKLCLPRKSSPIQSTSQTLSRR